jgi:hypothetical protein
MASKPNDFYIGVIDFFSIFIPGTVLLFLEQAKIVKLAKYLDLYALTGNASVNDASGIIWIAFAVASYVCGHFLFIIGRLMNQIHDRQREPLSYQVNNILLSKIGLTNNTKNSVLLRKVKIYILLHSSSGFSEVERQLANYKFFRTLTIVFSVDAIFSIFLLNPLRLSLSVFLLLVCFLRFKDLREETEKLALTILEFLLEKSQAPSNSVLMD